MEQWKDIIGYEGFYQVSDAGRVRSVDRCIIYSNGNIHYYNGQILKGFISTSGYMAVDLYNHKKRNRFYVHRLVAIHFVENKDPVYANEVNHIDENKLNNSVANLEWCTSSENTLHGTCIERANKTRKQKHIAEKAVAMYDLYGNLLCKFNCIEDAVRETGINRKSIYNSCNNRVKSRKYVWRYIA